MQDALTPLPRIGRLALVDLVRCPSHEARLAFPTLAHDVATRAGGRLAWAGSIDQQLVGEGLETFEDVLISEFSSGEACARALAMRSEWRPETFLSEMTSYTARPWARLQRIGLRAGFGALRMLGGGPTPAHHETPAAIHRMASGPPHDPDARQLDTLLGADRTGPAVMLNFLRYREEAAVEDRDDTGAKPSGAAAYAAYGRVSGPLIARLGGRVRYATQTMRAVAGGGEPPWSAFVAVEYPSRAAFIGMLADPRYQSALPLRESGLDSTRLLVCTAHAAFH